MTDVTTELPHMEAKWLSSVHMYLRKLSCRIELDKTYVPNTQRINDHHIMDLVIQSQMFAPKEVRLLNYCRMYLQVVTLSDITNATGQDLDLTMLNGTCSRLSSQTKWHQFNQKRPSANAWKIWRRANLLWANAQGHLHEPLGKWLQESKDQRRTWHAYTDSAMTLYVKSVFHTPIEYNVYYPTPTASTEYIYYSTVEQDRITELSFDAYPILAQDFRQGTWRVQLGFHTGILPATMTMPTRLVSISTLQTNLDFQAYIHTLAPWEIDLLQFLQLQQDVFAIMNKMQSGFSAASDGSVLYHTNGSFGWILATNDGERLVQAYGPVRGYRPTSYWAEGYGLLSVLRFLTRMQDYCQIPVDETTPWQWTVTSDNISLVEVINNMAKVSNPLELHDWTNWDIDQANTDEGDRVLTKSFDNGQPNSTLEPDWDVLHEIK